MPDDAVARTPWTRTLRWIALAVLAVAAAAGAIAFRWRRPGGAPPTVVAPTVIAPTVIAPTVIAPTVIAPTVIPAEPAELSEPEPPQPVDDVVAEAAAGYDGWTVVALRARAREVGVPGYSKLRKADLVAAVQERDAPLRGDPSTVQH